MAVGGGWVARVATAARGRAGGRRGARLHLIHLMFRHIFQASSPGRRSTRRRSPRYGRRFRDPDLLAMGLAAQGRLLLYSGRVPEGLALLDEAMVGVAAGEVSPIFAGQIYCSLIEACQEISDFARVAEWTTALTTWCEAQPGLVPFTGQCAVHRGQVMRVRGAYLSSTRRARPRRARYQTAEDLPPRVWSPARAGRCSGSEESSTQPRPPSSRRSASGTTRNRRWRCSGSPGPHRGRCGRRPPGAGRATRPGPPLAAAARRHRDTASRRSPGRRTTPGRGARRRSRPPSDVPPLSAMAGYAAGSVALAGGDPDDALPDLRKAMQQLAGAGLRPTRSPGRRCSSVARSATGRRTTRRPPSSLPLAVAFTDLGAMPAAQQVDRLLAPGRRCRVD